MKKRILVVVDMQYDFCDAEGALYVKGAERAVENVVEYIKNTEIDKVVFTADHHPANHCSFGMWPVHCVADTHGAAIVESLIQTCESKNVPYEMYYKGKEEGSEEYGAFAVRQEGQNPLSEFEEYEEVVVCGVAGDYCVIETIKNMKPLWIKMKVLSNGVVSIAGEEILADFVKETKQIEYI